MIMVVKSLEYSSTLFSYSNLGDWLPDLYCDPVLAFTTYVVEHLPVT